MYCGLDGPVKCDGSRAQTATAPRACGKRLSSSARHSVLRARTGLVVMTYDFSRLGPDGFEQLV